MALDEAVPIDGDGISTGTKVDEICAAIRALRIALNAGGLDSLYLMNSRCRYTKNDAQEFTDGNWEVVKYDDIDFDTLTEWDVDPWTFTAQNEGYYQVNAAILTARVAWTVNDTAEFAIYKNGAGYSYLQFIDIMAAETTYVHVDGSDIVYLNGTTDYIDIRVKINRGANTVLAANAIHNYISIHRQS